METDTALTSVYPYFLKPIECIWHCGGVGDGSVLVSEDLSRSPEPTQIARCKHARFSFVS